MENKPNVFPTSKMSEAMKEANEMGTKIAQQANIETGVNEIPKKDTELSAQEQMKKDSLDMTDQDRLTIQQAVQEESNEKIIITHGTMTMPETANYLGEHNIPKTIVLFGAAIPANQINSDALFNFGLALAAVKTLPHGVYVTMNGKIFSHDNVKKNYETGNFETLS